MNDVTVRLLIGIILTVAGTAAPGGQDDPAAPSTVVFDTGSPSAGPLSAAVLKSRSGWTAIAEDNLTHRFQGDAVVANDGLIVVLRTKAAGAEVYSRTAAGPKRRVDLCPASTAKGPSRIASVRILENNPGAVMLAAGFTAADGGTCSLTYRLTAGQVIVEVLPGAGADRLLVACEARYVIVPDFFGDDMVFRAERPSRLRLPAENFFVNLLDRGNAQVMCVWQSRKQEAVAVSSAGRQPALTGCEVQAMKGKSIWVAVLEGPNVWHERAISAADADAEVTLDWKPPFPAKWRADLVGSNGPARSWYFQGPEGAGEPLAKGPLHPCRLEGDRAVLRLRQDAAVSPSVWPYPAAMVVYAMDRTRATPLTTFCPIDVLRNTLGVGPCQYILQTEGLATDANPTPDSVATWIETQFKRKREKGAAAEMRELLDQMVQHVGHTQTRIEQYGRLAGDVEALGAADTQGGGAAGIEAIGRLAEKLRQTVAASGGTPGSADRATRLANQIGSLVGKPAAMAECVRIGAELRGIGAVQDRTLSNCRMTARWIKQSAVMVGEEDPPKAAWARKIAARVEQDLAEK